MTVFPWACCKEFLYGPLVDSVRRACMCMKGSNNNSPQAFDTSNKPDTTGGSRLEEHCIEDVIGKPDSNTPPLMRIAVKNPVKFICVMFIPTGRFTCNFLDKEDIRVSSSKVK